MKVIALGGNYIHEEKEMRLAARAISKYFKPPLILTHGNGPQAGELRKKTGFPLDQVVALTQASIGYPLSREIEKASGTNTAVLLTRTLVSKKDPEFKRPSKPIGKYYRKKADGLRYFAGRGWREIVPSPKPLRILESKAIKKLAASKNMNVVCCGGGGIPVTKRNVGIEAVVDKDLASAVLAKAIKVKELIILMKEPCVYMNYGKRTQERVPEIKIREINSLLKKGIFEQGTIAPKMKAAALFGGKTIITNAENIDRAIKGKEGTLICP